MAERNPDSNDAAGTPKSPDWNRERAAYEQLEEIRQYMRDLYSRRDIVARTVTKSGQQLDWVPIESQTPDGQIASPPDDVTTEVPRDPDRPTERVLPDLEYPDAELGPPGTVPLLRQPIDDIRTDGDLRDWLSKGGRARRGTLPRSFASVRADNDFHVHATADQIGTFYGTEGFINVWRPWVEWSDEFSVGQFWVQRGFGIQLQSIEAGVQVYKNLYDSWEPYIFIYYTTNGYTINGNNIGGYNEKVTGWKQTSQLVFPGQKISPHSQTGGTQYDMEFKLQYQLGNWWVNVNGHWMGYYPNGLFATTGLRDQADIVSWGGEVDDAVAHPGTTQTDMGSGLFPWEGFGRAAYMRNLMNQIDQVGTMSRFQGLTDADRSDCYDIRADFSGASAWGTHLYWGGTGRNPACP